MTTESKKILVGVAWPYVNGEKHIGQIAGAYLPPDIFARYQRLIGNDVRRTMEQYLWVQTALSGM